MYAGASVGGLVNGSLRRSKWRMSDVLASIQCGTDGRDPIGSLFVHRNTRSSHHGNWAVSPESVPALLRPGFRIEFKSGSRISAGRTFANAVLRCGRCSIRLNIFMINVSSATSGEAPNALGWLPLVHPRIRSSASAPDCVTFEPARRLSGRCARLVAPIPAVRRAL